MVPDEIWYEDDDGWRTIQLRPIKIWGIRHLNRAFHLDRVYVRFVDWIDWGSAGGKVINEQGFDFEEERILREYG